MRTHKRIYGIENELAVMIQDAHGSWHEVGTGRVKQQYSRDATSVYTYTQPVRLWHTNGACSYVDTGDHPEHATPECYLIKDAVLYAKTGELLMNSIFSKPFADGSGSRIILFKNNLGWNEKGCIQTFGCHENYLTHRLNFEKESTRKEFVPFLITRQIMDGAGWWEPDGKFLFSQRSIGMESEIGRATTSNRPLITIRDTMNDTGSGRLHLILGDANILDVACFLKLGTTSLVLSLIESECAPVIECRYPVTTMKLIAGQPDITIPYDGLVMNGKKLSVFDVQVIYYEAAKRHFFSSTHESEETRGELYMVLCMWEQALNAVYNRDQEWMLGRFDWATKQYLAECIIKDKKISSPFEIQELRKTIDILYHNITDRTLQNRMNKKWPNRRLITDQQIEKARYFPPQGTRARMRGLFVASILDIENRIKSDINWIYCGDGDLPADINKCDLHDPFAESDNKFTEFLLKSLSLPRNKIIIPQYYSEC